MPGSTAASVSSARSRSAPPTREGRGRGRTKESGRGQGRKGSSRGDGRRGGRAASALVHAHRRATGTDCTCGLCGKEWTVGMPWGETTQEIWDTQNMEVALGELCDKCKPVRRSLPFTDEELKSVRDNEQTQQMIDEASARKKGELP